MTIVGNEVRYNVSIGPGVYYVQTITFNGLHTHIVEKDKECTCGGNGDTPCCHIQAVKTYLKRGGARAPKSSTEVQPDDTPQDSSPHQLSHRHPAAVSECPICGGEVKQQGGKLWRCTQNSNNAHYWAWRGSKVKKFLTQSRPNKLGPFYDQTPEEREKFLAVAKEGLREYRRKAYSLEEG